MKLKFESEDEYKGMIILEAEPQYRSVFIHSMQQDEYGDFPGDPISIRLPFPYIEYVIQYEKIHAGYNGSKVYYKYKGVYGNGLRIFGKLTTLKHTSEEVFLFSIENDNYGTSCTEHSYDNKLYPSVTDLVNEVISLWWGHTHHHCNYFGHTIDIEYWKQSKLEDLANVDIDSIFGIEPKSCGFVKSNDLITVLKNSNYMTFDKKSEIINEQWPCGM